MSTKPVDVLRILGQEANHFDSIHNEDCAINLRAARDAVRELMRMAEVATRGEPSEINSALLAALDACQPDPEPPK